MASVSRVPGIAAALALIALPIVAFALRFVQPGWFLVVILIASPALLVAYALAVVIAVTGFLTPHAAFQLARVRWRGLTSAWVTAASIAIASFFAVDFGDTGTVGGPFTLVVGADGGVVVDISSALSVIFAALAIAALIWLIIEWIAALVQRRKRSTPISI